MPLKPTHCSFNIVSVNRTILSCRSACSYIIVSHTHLFCPQNIMDLEALIFLNPTMRIWSDNSISTDPLTRMWQLLRTATQLVTIIKIVMTFHSSGKRSIKLLKKRFVPLQHSTVLLCCSSTCLLCPHISLFNTLEYAEAAGGQL